MEIEFDFYDLAVIPGLYANGTAEISVRPDGVNDEPEWFVGRIFLHGENNKLEEIENDFVGDGQTISRKIYLRIFDILENDPTYSGKINDQIITDLLASRIDRARSYAREFA